MTFNTREVVDDSLFTAVDCDCRRHR